MEEVLENYQRHMSWMAPFNAFVPKHHLLWHLIGNSEFLGNPIYYANWEDESCNKSLKGCCRFVSQANFEGNVCLRMRELLRRRGEKRSRDEA